MMKKITTLCTVVQGEKILLGMKKRGFGQGWWNGFGGKVQPSETIEAAAIRECQEEAGIVPKNMSAAAQLMFYFENSSEVIEVHVFLVEAFEGEPQESEEMRPQWFAFQDIPYNKMWADDPHWLPAVLAGKRVRGKFWFADTKTLLRHEVVEL